MSPTRCLSSLLTYAVAAVILAGPASIFGDTFDFAYDFGSGHALVTGSLTGDVNGNFVDNVGNVTLLINGNPVIGNIFTAKYVANSYSNGPIVSFDVSQNNFMFCDSDMVHYIAGYSVIFAIQYSGTSPLSPIPHQFASLGSTDDIFNPLVNGLDAPPKQSSWSLTDITPEASVPDDDMTVAMLGSALAGLALFRRRFVA